jgi:uncharacterized membrane protein YjfL (UPF0719 family)
MNIEQYGINLLYALVCVTCMLVLKYALNIKAASGGEGSGYNSDEELSNGNLAVGLRRTGAQFGLAISIMGALSGANAASLTQDLLSTAIYGLVSVGFILSSLLITDRFVLPGINNAAQLKANNHAVGYVEFSMLVATGIIAYSSIVGDGGTWLSSLAYFVTGQVSLVLLVFFYEKIRMRKFNILTAIAEGQVASGLYLGGKMIAYALILKSAIAGNAADTAFSTMAIEFVTLAISGMVILFIFELVIDWLIITTTKVSSILSKNEIVQAVQLAGAKIGLAMILSNSVL